MVEVKPNEPLPKKKMKKPKKKVEGAPAEEGGNMRAEADVVARTACALDVAVVGGDFPVLTLNASANGNVTGGPVDVGYALQ
jgi:hypothetical protein